MLAPQCPLEQCGQSAAGSLPPWAATGPFARYRLTPQESAIRLSAVKILRTAEGESPDAWRAALQSDWLSSAQVLKDDPAAHSWVRRATLRGQNVVIKCRALNSLSRRLKHAIGMGHAHKQWRGADRLAQAGIATGRPLAMIRVTIDAVESELLILEYIHGKTLLELLDEISRGVGPSIREQHAIARAVGAVIPRLLKSRWCNRDHKPSNLIVMHASDRSVNVAILDCVGIRRYGSMGIDGGEVEEMLASLMIEPLGCGCPPRRALWARALRAVGWTGEPRLRTLRETIDEVRELIDVHGDPRPRVNPLQGP